MVIPPFVRTTSHALFSAFFPDDCRICRTPLDGYTAVPVCRRCLEPPEPFSAEFWCAGCRTPFLNAYPLDENGFCALCRAGARGFDAAWTFGAFEGRLRDLVLLFKYSGMQALDRPLAQWMNRALPLDARIDAIIPVPLHWWKRFTRGYNQSELLARHIAAARRLPVLPALVRQRRTPTQTGLTPAQRRRNVAGAFRVARGRQLAGKRLLVVDDVMTTGATASACARALRQAGAVSVSILTLARAERRLVEPATPRRKSITVGV